MIYLMMTDRSYKDVPDATSAKVEGGEVVCRDFMGAPVATFDAQAVTSYGTHKHLQNPAALSEPVGVDIRRNRELAAAPLASLRMRTLSR